MITSLTNKHIKELAELKTTKGRKLSGKFIVEGKHLVSEAKALGILEEVYTISEDLEGILISNEVMKKLCNTNTIVNQIGICKKMVSNKISNKILILDAIQDPGNLGALMRSAKAFNFDTLFLGNGTVDPYNDKVIRSSQGAIFKLNILEGNAKDFILGLKDYKVYSTNVVNGIDVKNIEKEEKMALILGNEGNGVSEEIKKLNLPNLYIEINNTESLNVAVAGSILMYELNK